MEILRWNSKWGWQWKFGNGILNGASNGNFEMDLCNKVGNGNLGIIETGLLVNHAQAIIDQITSKMERPE